MEISLDWSAIMLLTAGSWIISGIWFGFIFGKLWKRIHHGDTVFTEEEKETIEKYTWLFMFIELLATFIMIMALDVLIKILPGFSSIYIAFFVWVGFILPAIASSVIWGNDIKKWMIPKVLISSTGRLLSFILAGYILSIWK